MKAKPPALIHRARFGRDDLGVVRNGTGRSPSLQAFRKTLQGILVAALLFGSGNLFGAPPTPDVKATQTGTFPSHPDSRAREGDTIDYTTIISNTTGTADATGVQLTNPTPANTTDTGTITVSPLAFPDSYNAGKNTPLNVAAAQGVLVNDTGTPAPSAVPIAGGATTQGGTVTLNADGSFS